MELEPPLHMTLKCREWNFEYLFHHLNWILEFISFLLLLLFLVLKVVYLINPVPGLLCPSFSSSSTYTHTFCTYTLYIYPIEYVSSPSLYSYTNSTSGICVPVRHSSPSQILFSFSKSKEKKKKYFTFTIFFILFLDPLLFWIQNKSNDMKKKKLFRRRRRRRKLFNVATFFSVWS